MENLHALVIGATGATGRELVNKLLLDDDFSQVTIFVRNAPTINHKKLNYTCTNPQTIHQRKGHFHLLFPI